ncbi:MAG: hypothetical protein M1819_000777 [Sarea resinae]|nr:MAG: hypothetical protein M1819_000777 [Sarea resinae]
MSELHPARHGNPAFAAAPGGDEDVDSDARQKEGVLIRLKTKEETRATNETGENAPSRFVSLDCYILDLPAKFAHGVYSALRTAFPDDRFDLQHLRRFAKPSFLPLHLRPLSSVPAKRSHSPHETSTPNGAAESEAGQPLPTSQQPPLLHLLVGPVKSIPRTGLTNKLMSLAPFSDGSMAINLRTVSVPALAPTAEEQAQRWSEQYWPTVYKKTNPFGPQPSVWDRAERDILPGAGRWMALAEAAGQAAKHARTGEPFGAVIVDNTPDGQNAVAVAGDARWCGPGAELASGNVAGHAVMRAIGMVALKAKRAKQQGSRNDHAQTPQCGSDSREEGEKEQEVSRTITTSSTIFLDTPLTSLEERYFMLRNVSDSAYLCCGQDIYLSHEPCLMCAMAILHSRFERVVFGTRMPGTGGLCADMVVGDGGADGADMKTVDGDRDRDGDARKAHSPIRGQSHQGLGLGYGLFWLHDLNWKMLAWQWQWQDSARHPDSVTAGSKFHNA